MVGTYTTLDVGPNDQVSKSKTSVILYLTIIEPDLIYPTKLSQ